MYRILRLRMQRVAGRASGLLAHDDQEAPGGRSAVYELQRWGQEAALLVQLPRIGLRVQMVFICDFLPDRWMFAHHWGLDAVS